MTLAEYDAWFIAFSESGPCPTGAARSSKIRERVGDIDGVAVSPTLFRARYDAEATILQNLFGFDAMRAMQALGYAESHRLA